jgi:hypothetical protein
MPDEAQLVREYRQAEKRAARAREVLATAARGATMRRTLLGDLVGKDWPDPIAGVTRHAQEVLPTAEREAALRLAMLAELVGPDRAASMAGVSRQTLNTACRLIADEAL